MPEIMKKILSLLAQIQVLEAEIAEQLKTIAEMPVSEKKEGI